MCRIETFIKAMLILANISAIIGAIAYLTIGIICHLPTMQIVYFFVLSGLLPVAAILGCLGIWKESLSLITVYAILILCIIITDMLAIIPFNSEDNDNIYMDLKFKIEKTWLKEIEQPGAIDKLQELYKCCGKDSAKDFTKVLHRTIPKSCYDSNYGTLYKTGCLKSAENYKTLGVYFTVLTWINTIIDIIWFGFACAIVVRFKKRDFVLRRRKLKTTKS